jgi:transcriptional regulator with PAS, ATPase and Fis domain
MLQVFDSVLKVARSQSAVLILGESGTGKELIASAIHRLSLRADRRFYAFNCSAIPENLIESELFGYVKGAFTGANARKLGLFEIAEGGTIFLDEIGDMPLNLQVKLLRVLQEKKFIPLGSTEERTADARIIAATNMNLLDAVTNKQFRADLYYRLNVLPVHLPPLHERKEDIALLLRHFLRISNRMHGLAQPCALSDEVMKHLSAYSWPGNVRQLQNLVERLVVMRGGGIIRLHDLPAEYMEHPQATVAMVGKRQETKPAPTISRITQAEFPSESLPHSDIATMTADLPSSEFLESLFKEGFRLTDYIENLENHLICRALTLTANNRNQAAKILGMNRTTLVERIKKRSIGREIGIPEVLKDTASDDGNPNRELDFK